MKKVSLLFSLALLFCSCQKDEVGTPERISSQELYACNEASGRDSLQIVNAIPGRWQWQYQRCFWSGEAADEEAGRGVVVEIREDGTYLQKMDGALVQTGNWELERAGSSIFRLKTEPVSEFLLGPVALCRQWLVFADSWLDGCDNYFTQLP